MSLPSNDRKSEESTLDKDNLQKLGVASHIEQNGDDTQVGVFDDSIENTKASKAVWLITITVGMGGFLFGEPDSICLCCDSRIQIAHITVVTRVRHWSHLGCLSEP